MQSPTDTLTAPSSSLTMLQALQKSAFLARPHETGSSKSVDALEVPSYRESDLQKGRCLGSGGYAKVHTVTINGLPVAWKYFTREDVDQAIIANEVWTQNKVPHPNILPVIGVTQQGDKVTGVMMPLAKGGTLSSLIERSKSIPMRVAIAIMKTLLDAVLALHEHNIVHRDLKLENVLIDDEEIVSKNLAELSDEELGKLTKSLRLADFGIAGLTDDVGQLVTQYNPYGGTPGYKAPEIAGKFRMASFASDIYALGVLWYALVTGDVLPYPASFYSDSGRELDDYVASGHTPASCMSMRFSQTESRVVRDRLVTQVFPSMWSQNSMRRPSAKELVSVLDELEQTASLRAKL